MFDLLKWSGNQKAVVGGFVSFVFVLLAQYNINQNMTLKEALTALASGLFTHLGIYFKTNSK